ncbi:class II glutamine amidotransferase [Microbaculum marinum]|uniref:Class II glutamine amidotransferase n=1 Tax=Microbaculum marinum TaxID=1764581 RepID=A0AAW9RXU9_9HYPH
MCRLVAYSGEPIYLETQLSDPPRSLIRQSREARESHWTVNGDGCGVGWYGNREAPGLYRSVRPAWGDSNLLSICHQLRSPMFAGHIRAATAGEVATANCHPFAVGRRLFMHNGYIGGYTRIRRAIEMMIPADLYRYRKGASDSEAIFLIAMGRGMETDPIAAMAQTLSDIVALNADLDHNEPLELAAVHTDGESLWAFRWARHHIAPTLYHRAFGSGVVIASEPYDDQHSEWHAVPEDSVIVVRPDRSMEISPFLPRQRPARTASR